MRVMGTFSVFRAKIGSGGQVFEFVRTQPSWVARASATAAAIVLLLISLLLLIPAVVVAAVVFLAGAGYVGARRAIDRFRHRHALTTSDGRRNVRVIRPGAPN